MPRSRYRQLARKASRLLGRGVLNQVQDADFVILEDALAKTSKTSAIPLRLVQTGPKRLIHPKHLQAINAFRDENNDLDHLFFDNEAADSYMREEWGSHPIWSIYDRSLFGQMKADIFRYCYVFQHGGFYLDLNKLVSQKLTSFIDESNTGLVSFEKNDLVVISDYSVAKQLDYPTKVVLQWCFAFAPRHHILELAINRIVELEEFFVDVAVRRALHGVVSFTGPGVFTWAVHKFAASEGLSGISQIPPDFNNLGVTRIRESDRAFGGPHYGSLKDQVILRAPER